MDQPETIVHQVEKVQTDEVEAEMGQPFRHAFGLLMGDRETGSADDIDTVETDPAGVIDEMIPFDPGKTVFPGRGIQERREIRSTPRHVIRDYKGEQAFVGGDDTHAGCFLRNPLGEKGQRGENEDKYFFHKD